MYYRRKIFLALLESFGGTLDSTDFEKLLFLFCKETSQNFYDFFPYRFGCFSHISYQDKRVLTKLGYLEEADKLILNKKTSIFCSLKETEKVALKHFTLKFSNVRGYDLVKYTYLKYPYFAVRSEIANKVLNQGELKAIPNIKQEKAERTLFTVGYEGLTIDSYINKLIFHNISLIVDVRKNPLSMKYGFSKTKLKTYLEKAGITYKHFPELGVSSILRKKLNAESDYKELFNFYYENILPSNLQYIYEILELLKIYNRIALTCFEEKHVFCHRHKITEWLNTNNYAVNITHI